jgi:hypothetical protein
MALTRSEMQRILEEKKMALTRWLTNLEDVNVLKQAVYEAKRAVNASPGDKATEHALYVAQYKLADVTRSLEQIRMETHGRFTIGEPMATESRTEKEIAADGIVGIYREGVGTGA